MYPLLCPSHSALPMNLHLLIMSTNIFATHESDNGISVAKGFGLLASNWFKIEYNDFFCVKILKCLTAVRLYCLSLIKVHIVHSY